MTQLEFMFSRAPASLAIIVAIVVVSLIGFRSREFTERFLLYPWKLFRGKQYERLIVSGFLHADMMHLLFNLIALYSVSMYVEAAAGTPAFLVIYFGSLIISGIIPAIRKRNDPDYRALGASGAVSGLFFAGMLYFPEAKVMLLFLPIPMPWPVFAVLFIAGSMYGARRKWDNVAHDVHIYGALSGLLLTIAVDPSSLGTFLHAVGLGG
ncbi:MAG: rhomboid family intramembrane serine protease [Bacteroidetes bacterium]|nr:rhomboid family intramembrane serine protease [Bacteroidota bacterium]